MPVATARMCHHGAVRAMEEASVSEHHLSGHRDPATRLLIVDDHELVAAALAELLRDHAEFAVVGLAHTCAEAEAIAVRERVALVLTDQRLPDGDGISLGARLRSLDPELPVVILTADPTPAVVEGALASGCAGVIGKGAPVQELLAALRAAANGGTYFSREALTNAMVQRRAEEVQDRLSERERDVLQRIADGRTTRQIADELHLSQHTVRNHLRRALARLDSHTKLDAVIVAAGRGEIVLDRDRGDA